MYSINDILTLKNEIKELKDEFKELKDEINRLVTLLSIDKKKEVVDATSKTGSCVVTDATKLSNDLTIAQNTIVTNINSEENKKNCLSKKAQEYVNLGCSVKQIDLNENGYIGDIDFSGKYNILICPQGTGKTETIKNYCIKSELNTIVFTGNTSASRELSKRFNFANYQDQEGILKNNSVCGLLSAYRVDIDNGLIIIDEAAQGLGFFANDNFRSEHKEPDLESIKNLFKKNNKVILADADFTPRSVSLWAEIMGVKLSDINVYISVKKEEKIILNVNDLDVFKTMLYRDLEVGKILSIPVTSKMYGEQLYNDIKKRYPQKKGLLINSDTVLTIEIKQDYNNNNWNKLLLDVDYIIFSPIITNATSWNHKIKVFDKVFCWGVSGGADVTIINQMIGRARKVKDVVIFVQDTQHKKDYYKSELDYLKQTSKYKTIIEVAKSTNGSIDFDQIKFDTFDNLCAYNELRLQRLGGNGYSLVKAVNDFYSGLEYDEGSYKIFTEDDIKEYLSKNSFDDLTFDKIKKRTSRKNSFVKLVAQSNLLPLKMAKKVLEEIKTEESEAIYTKALLVDTYGEEILENKTMIKAAIENKNGIWGLFSPLRIAKMTTDRSYYNNILTCATAQLVGVKYANIDAVEELENANMVIKVLDLYKIKNTLIDLPRKDLENLRSDLRVFFADEKNVNFLVNHGINIKEYESAPYQLLNSVLKKFAMIDTDSVQKRINGAVTRIQVPNVKLIKVLLNIHKKTYRRLEL